MIYLKKYNRMKCYFLRHRRVNDILFIYIGIIDASLLCDSVTSKNSIGNL